jgi:hypothetical protein
MTYRGCHTAQKGARAAVIGPWSEHSKLGEVRTKTNAEKWRKGKERKKKKERNKQTKQGAFPPLHSTVGRQPGLSMEK